MAMASRDDDARRHRTIRQMQEDALQLADRYISQEQFRIFDDVGALRESIAYGLQSKDDLAGLVLKMVTFIDNFEPMIFGGVDPLYGPAYSELSAAHLAANGRMDLALQTLGYEA